MSTTTIVSALLAGVITGLLGARAGVSMWITAIVGGCAGIAVGELSMWLGLP
jgi:hypothetical protein